MSMRERTQAQDGFTLVEVVIAATIAIVIVLAISATLDKALFNSLGHERRAAMQTIAQREVENVRQIVAQYGFAALAMSGQPAAPSGGALAVNPSNPSDFITGYGTASAAFRVMESFHITTRGVASGTPAAGEPLVIGATASYPTAGRVTPVSTLATSGTVSATIYRFVTQRTEACTTANACNGDSRRVIIAIVPTNNPTTELQNSQPLYVTTVINNPVPQDEPGNAGSGLRIGVNIG